MRTWDGHQATGPRSAEGKARSSQNGLRCAFLSSDLLIPGESPKALAKLREGLREQIRPVGAVERILVERAANILWRIGRLHKIETALWRAGLEGIGDPADSEADEVEPNYHPLQEALEQDNETSPF